MKKYRLILSMLAVLLCITVTGCSSKDKGISPILGDVLPEKITSIEVSGFYNGHMPNGRLPMKYGTVDRLISSMSMMENCPSHGYILTRHISDMTVSGMKSQTLLHRRSI